MKRNYLIIFFAIALLATSVSAQSSSLKILEQPKPELPQRHGTLDVQGTVVLKVEFMDIGEIGDVVVVRQLTNELDQKAIAAVRKIKFEPEKKDGKAVGTFKTLEYYYSWNGGWRDLKRDENAAAKPAEAEKAEAIIAKAIAALGGERYLKVTSRVSRGSFTLMKEGQIASFQSFVDVIVFPDSERTDFKGGGSRIIQTNTGDTGWIFDGDQEIVKVQTEKQIADFKQAMRTNIDTLLRGGWRGKATLAYLGRRPATLGKRNDAIKLTYDDGFTVEYEFAVDTGFPQKAMFKRQNIDGDELREEDRYAQFLEIDGIKVPFVIDRFTNGMQSSRINFETLEFNKPISSSVFAKPANAKEAKKEIKF